MPTPSDVLLIDVGIQPMQVLASRLQQMAFRALRVKTPEEARQALLDPRYRIAVGVLPPDLPSANLAAALQRLREAAPGGELSFLASGFQPDRDSRSRLRHAGVEFGLWDPVDQHTLRFLVNRASAGSVLGPLRGALRVPADWPVRVASGGREKPARVYSISSGGAYLVTPRPSVRQSVVQLILPLPTGPVHATGRVVMTNVPGNLLRPNLPIGMGICFTDIPAPMEDALQGFVTERTQTLSV